jgi:protein-S-isoprenylcysteine O-methyltransferase Ste14
LITSGPYGVTRHPVYTGVIGFFAGLALLWNSGATLLLAIGVVVPLFVHTLIEERLFAAHFGEAYADYRRRVPRLVPGWRSGGRGKSGRR